MRPNVGAMLLGDRSRDWTGWTPPDTRSGRLRVEPNAEGASDPVAVLAGLLYTQVGSVARKLHAAQPCASPRATG